MRRVLLTTVVAATAAAAGLVAGPVLSDPRTSGSRAPGPVEAAETRQEGPPTAAGIEFFEQRVEVRPADAVSWTVLGELYHQLGRETGTDEPFARSEQALREAVRRATGYERAQAALAATLTSRHRFGEAIAIATELLAQDPERADVLATRGDALISIGRYTAATADYERLQELDPGAGSLARLAQIKEVTGDPEGALELIGRAAAELDGIGGERAAWVLYRQGDLNGHLGRWEAARRSFEESIRRLDGYPLALEGLVDVALKTGDLADADRWLDRLKAGGPRIGTWLLEADLTALQGDEEAAADLVAKAVAELERLDPVLVGRDLAVVLADNGLRLDEAVRLAVDDLHVRPDVFAFDAVAWTRFHAGDIDGARASIDRALALGTKEPSFLYHSALIAVAEGDGDRARLDLEAALDVNPAFDPFDAPAATALLAAEQAS